MGQTILTKVVTSQVWLRTSHVEPNYFIIFCWLPFEIHNDISDCANEFMNFVNQQDPRFTLRLRLPSEADELFPAKFACNQHAPGKRSRQYSWSDVDTFSGFYEDSSDDDCVYDTNWLWKDDVTVSHESVSDDAESSVIWSFSPSTPVLKESDSAEDFRAHELALQAHGEKHRCI